MTKKYLAYISPLEDITDKEYANCNITFITGDLDHRTFSGLKLKTDLFRYYYYGSSLEVVELDRHQNVVDIHDITVEEAKYFGVSLHYILTLNQSTFDMLASNDFTYNLKVNKFYSYCKTTVENMYCCMQRLNNFILRAYVINGAVVYIELDDNPGKERQYALTPGFIISDKSKLKNAGGKEVTVSGHSREKLKQEDIDKLITKLIR